MRAPERKTAPGGINKNERTPDMLLSAAALFVSFSIASSSDFALGADLSFAGSEEEKGVRFKAGGKPTPVYRLFRRHGFNWVRLRLFVEPEALPNDLNYTLREAKKAKREGMKLLLDFHYADDWADPAHQPTPRAWRSLGRKQLEQQVFDYTRRTIERFAKEHVLPDMVQIGNEVIAGMLWPVGRLPENWEAFADLVRAGVRGVEAGAPKNKTPKIMIHIDRGGDKAAVKWFFDKFNSFGIPYDAIGLSFYPWWHGSMADLKQTLEFTALEYNKDVYLVETAYHWMPAAYVGKDAPYPESPEGQKQFWVDAAKIVRSLPGGRGKGIFWWEPAVTGHLGSRSFFDVQGNALPALSAFEKRR